MARRSSLAGAFAVISICTVGAGAGGTCLVACGGTDDPGTAADAGAGDRDATTSLDGSGDVTPPKNDSGIDSGGRSGNDAGGDAKTDATVSSDGSAPDAMPGDDDSGNDGGSGSGIDAGQDSGSGGGTDAGPLSAVHFYGRFDTSAPDEPVFDWSGTGIVADFVGTGVAVTLRNTRYGGTGNNEMQVVIDGTPAASGLVLNTSGDATYTLASNLDANTQHHVELYKRTEALYGYVQFKGFSSESTLDTSWALVPTPDPVTRRLEFIGDSITCGFGILGPDTTCQDDGAYNDAYAAYGALTARALGASFIDISYSGKGAYEDYHGNTTESDPSDPQMPAQYLRTVENEPSSVYDFATKMDVVVINLGTNDFEANDIDPDDKYPKKPFTTAYEGLISTVRSHYPDAYILLVAGPIVTPFNPFTGASARLMKDLDQMVADFAAIGDTNVADLLLDPEPDCYGEDGNPDLCGCQGHPNVAEAQAMANAIVPKIQAAEGW